MSWREAVKAHAASRGRKVYESKLGIGIEFQDRSDAFWLLPGEPMSSVEVNPSQQVDVNSHLAEYDRINELRRQTLHVLRHHLAESNIRVAPCSSGRWWFDTGSMSGEIWAGEALTSAAAKSKSVAETVENWDGAYWGSRRPSERHMEGYLEVEELPPDPVVEQVELEKQSISKALEWMGLCNAINRPESWGDVEAMREAVEPRGRIGRALRRLAERLPHSTATCDLLKPGSLCIDFSDGNASFDIDTRSRELAKRFRSNTPESVGDQLADEFEQLEAARSILFDAVWQAAAEMNWNVDRFGFAFFGIAPKVMLGRVKREVEFRVADELSDLLRAQSPEKALVDLFSGHPKFRDVCLSALRSPGRAVTEADLPKASLMPATTPDSVPLRTIDESMITLLDQFAKATLDEAFLGDEHELLWKYGNSEFYNAETDDWLPRNKWNELATRQLDNEWPSPIAIKILLDDDVESADVAARDYVQKLGEAHHESDEATIELIWRYRHDYPEVARVWLSSDAPSDYDEVRASLGDPVATRRTSFVNLDDDYDEWDAKQVRRLSARMQAAAHQEYVAWAMQEHRCSPLDVNKLRVAGQLGWTDVFDALEENPYLVPGLLCIDDRPDCYDEPGLLVGSVLLLVWSAYAPSRFLGRIVATARDSDMVALAQEASRRDVARSPNATKESLKWAFQTYDIWAEQLRLHLAIAWNRCRRFFDSPVKVDA